MEMYDKWRDVLSIPRPRQSQLDISQMFELVDKTTNKLHKINIEDECSKAGGSLPFHEYLS